MVVRSCGHDYLARWDGYAWAIEEDGRSLGWTQRPGFEIVAAISKAVSRLEVR